MIKRFNYYYLILLAIIAFSCDESEKCEITDLSAVVQDKKVSVNISVRSTENIKQYNWYFSDSFSLATLSPSVEHVLTHNGEYLVEVEAESVSGEICSLQEVFFVNDSSIVRDTCDVDISNIEIDQGEITANATIEGSYNGALFIWDNGVDDYDTTLVPRYETEYALAGNYPLKVYYTQGGCQDSAIKYVNIDEVSPQCGVGKIPLPNLEGSKISFPYSSNEIPGNPIFSFDFGDGTPIINIETSYCEHTFQEPGIYRIKVKLEFENGQCSNERIFIVNIKDEGNNSSNSDGDFQQNTNDSITVLNYEGNPQFEHLLEGLNNWSIDEIVFINF